jgi:hypothetical protein
VDINLSSDDDTINAPKLDVLAGQKAPTGDDARDDGTSSAKPTAPNPISFDVPKQSDPSTTDQVLTIVPPAGGCGRKHPPPPPPATKWTKPITSADQVMSQVELPPYRGPHSPLD